MGKIDNIIVHCSDSGYGCASVIRDWHVGRGFCDIGYHFVILNGKPHAADFYLPPLDGSIEVGRPLGDDLTLEGAEIGAHALGYNSKSIGVCLVGTTSFSSIQLASLCSLLRWLMFRYKLHWTRVIGHYETDSGRAQGKTCPNVNMAVIRERLGKVK